MKRIILLVLMAIVATAFASDCPVFNYPDSTMLGEKYSVIKQKMTGAGCKLTILDSDPNPYYMCDCDSGIASPMNRKFGKLNSDFFFSVSCSCECFADYGLRDITLYFYHYKSDTLLFMVEKRLADVLPDDLFTGAIENYNIKEKLILEINKKAGFTASLDSTRCFGPADRFILQRRPTNWAIWDGKSVCAALPKNSPPDFIVASKAVWNKYQSTLDSIREEEEKEYEENIKSQENKIIKGI